eukprot:gene7496-15337_t
MGYNDSSTVDSLKEISDSADFFDEDRSAMTFSSSASSSKEVLVASRTLQDKIRRLETERSQALYETEQLRNHVSNLEIESEHKKRKDVLEYQRSLQEIRNIIDKLSADKDELESRIVKIEEKSLDSRTEFKVLMSRIKTLEHEKILSETRTSDTEKDSQNLKQQLIAAQQREKDLSQTMVWETKRHDEEMTRLISKVQVLRRELSETSLERLESKKKLEELDTLVRQLLSVNESLINHQSDQVSYVKTTRRSPSKKQKTKSSFTANSASRLSTAATISSEKKSKKTSTQARIGRDRDITRRAASVQTQKKDVYTNTAENINRGRFKQQQGDVSNQRQDSDPPHTGSSILDRSNHAHMTRIRSNGTYPQL